MNWSNYIGDNTIANFEREYNCNVVYDNFTNNEELYAKLKTGKLSYDVVVPSDYMVKRMITENMLRVVNKDSILNLKNIDKRYMDLDYDPNNNFSVPYQVGTTGIGIDTSKVHLKEVSWDVLFDLKYKGKISILDDMRYGMIPALKKLGYSINTTSEKELNEALDLMKAQKKLVRIYTSDNYINLLASGEIWIAYGFSGDIMQANKKNKNIVYYIPKEGTAYYIDNLVIPSNSKNPSLAVKFINYILDAKVSANITNQIMYTNPNQSAMEYIDTKVVDNPNIFPDSSLMKKNELIKDLGKNTLLYDKIWTSIKTF